MRQAQVNLVFLGITHPAQPVGASQHSPLCRHGPWHCASLGPHILAQDLPQDLLPRAEGCPAGAWWCRGGQWSYTGSAEDGIVQAQGMLQWGRPQGDLGHGCPLLTATGAVPSNTNSNQSSAIPAHSNPGWQCHPTELLNATLLLTSLACWKEFPPPPTLILKQMTNRRGSHRQRTGSPERLKGAL